MMAVITLFLVLNSSLCIFANIRPIGIKTINENEIDSLPIQPKVDTIVKNHSLSVSNLECDTTLQSDYEKYNKSYNELVMEVNKYVNNTQIVETNYGKTGVGRQHKKSLFGVIGKKYKNYNDAINDWCILVKNKYMAKSKTEPDLIKNYTTPDGDTYCAKSHLKEYFSKMSSTYNQLKNGNKKIQHLYKKVKNDYKKYN